MLSQVAPQQPLMEAGLDSLAAVELRNQLAARFSVDLAPTLSFDFPTAAALASHIACKMTDSSVEDLSATYAAQPGLSLEELEDQIQLVTAEVMGTTVAKHQVCRIFAHTPL